MQKRLENYKILTQEYYKNNDENGLKYCFGLKISVGTTENGPRKDPLKKCAEYQHYRERRGGAGLGPYGDRDVHPGFQVRNLARSVRGKGCLEPPYAQGASGVLFPAVPTPITAIKTPVSNQ